MKAAKFSLFSLAMLLLLQGCASAIVTQKKEKLRATSKLSISRVSVNKKTFQPLEDKKISIKFYLSKPAGEGRINLYDSNQRLLNTLKIDQLKQGFNAAFWDGKDSKGSLAKSDIVVYTITVQNDNEIFTYDPADETAGIEVRAREFTYDKTTGKIYYVLPRAARVRLRAGIKDGPLLNTIFDWIPQEAGEHTYLWDGRDESKNLYFSKHPQLNLNLTSYTLPANAIIIKGGSSDIPEDENLPQRRSEQKSKANKYFHYLHKLINCREPDFSLSFPGAELNKDGIPVLKAKAPLRVEIAPKDKQYLINKRFEVMFYVDTIFIYEEEESSSPFTFYWDTREISRGEHLLTVNIMSYDDHIGTKTQKVFIDHKAMVWSPTTKAVEDKQ